MRQDITLEDVHVDDWDHQVVDNCPLAATEKLQSGMLSFFRDRCSHNQHTTVLLGRYTKIVVFDTITLLTFVISTNYPAYSCSTWSVY